MFGEVLQFRNCILYTHTLDANVCTQNTAVTVTLEYAAIHYFAHYRSWLHEGEESITIVEKRKKHDNLTDIAICDTMRINDDGSLNIPKVNRRKHQGTWHCLDSQGNGATLDIKLQIAGNFSIS